MSFDPNQSKQVQQVTFSYEVHPPIILIIYQSPRLPARAYWTVLMKISLVKPM